MSHKTTINTKVSSLSSLQKALDRLGIKYKVGNHKTRGNYGVHEDVDVILENYGGKSLNNAVGFKQGKDGNFQFTGDFYGLRDDQGNSLSQNNFGDRVENAYNFEEINNKLSTLGFSCDNSNLDFTKKEVNFVMQRMV